MIIDCKKIADSDIKKYKEKIALLKNKPSICFIACKDVNLSYLKAKKQTLDYCKIKYKDYFFDKENEILDKIDHLNSDKNIHGILVQLPLKKEFDTYKILNSIDFRKDIDCLTKTNQANLFCNPYIYPCTVSGILQIIDTYKYPTEDKNVIIINRSNLIGLPLGIILSSKKYNSNVTILHSKTKNLKQFTSKADIIISAAGVPKLVTDDMILDKQIIIDVGLSYQNNKLCGDVFVTNQTCFITKNPGGVGLLTRSNLVKNIIKCYKLCNNIK